MGLVELAGLGGRGGKRSEGVGVRGFGYSLVLRLFVVVRVVSWGYFLDSWGSGWQRRGCFGFIIVYAQFWGGVDEEILTSSSQCLVS